MKKLFITLLIFPGFLFSFSAAAQTTFVHLFEWQWNAIASECENHLGPKGYAAVQVSPPQKSISGNQWWTRYQPVSYSIEGRLGTRAEFASMVSRCHAVGVDIYVDAVINHMSAGNRNFPEVPFGTNDNDYSDVWSIQNCDLVGLNDLKTESDYVRGKIADYMNDLISLGVTGFRIVAAKYMLSGDMANIVIRLDGDPYIFQEVIRAGGAPVLRSQYAYVADVTDFNSSKTRGHYFKGRRALRYLRNIGVWSGWLSSADAVTFVANHDNQRQNTNNTVTHKDGMNVNNIAHVFALAWPYGYPKVMSSYDWNDHDQGPPPSAANTCANGWLCEHRNREIANMVGFRNATQSAFYVSNWWDNGANQIAFGRGDRGFVVINGESGGTLNTTLQTGLAAGTYCDVIKGDFSNGVCTGPTITVGADGNASFSVDAKGASAIHADAIVGPTTGNQCVYDTMNLRGTFNSWNSHAMTCANGIWTGSANFSGSSNDRFKFDVYGDWQTSFGDANNDGIANLGGADIAVASAGDYTITFNDASLAYTFTPATSSSSSSNSSSTPGTVAVNFTCENGSTYVGRSVYVVGNNTALGNRSAVNAVRLDPISYPTWTGTIQLPANTAIEWKCLKREESNPAAGVEWEAGGNNSVNTGNGANTTGGF